MCDRVGAVIGGMAIMQDATARRQARRLHDARARAAELIAANSDDLPARMVSDVAPVLACRMAVYWERDAEGRLRPAASWVQDPGVVEPAELEAGTRASGPGSPLVAAAFATGRWGVVPDLQAAEPVGWVRAALASGARAAAAVPTLRGGTPVGVFEFFAPVPIEDDPDVAATMTALVDDVAHAWERQNEIEALQELADHDALTGLLNRRPFEEELRRQAAATARYGRRVAVLIIDLDDFKGVNDRHGHAVGDEVLREVAGVLRRRLRASDRAARLGGDEFAVIIEGADDAATARVAAQLACDLAAVRLAGGPEVRITASVGFAALGEDWRAALDAADQAMYADKRRGG